MHKRNRLYVTIGLIYALFSGLLMIVRLADPTLIPGNVPHIHGHMMLLGFVLMTSGVWMLVQGTLASDGALRPVGIHLFGAGFVLSLI